MRSRSKSMYIERENGGNIVEIGDDDGDNIKQKTNAWTAEDDMRLIRQMWEQLRSNDTLPYTEQLEKIDWKKIIIFGQKSSSIKERFEQILKSVRKYRLLSEIIKDIEKQTLKEINLPEKPVPPFVLFLKDNKDKLKKIAANSSKSYSQCASELFRELSNNEKEDYKRRSNNIKHEYKEIISKYNLENVSIYKGKEKKITPLSLYWDKAKRKDPNANYNEVRKEYINMDETNRLKLILKTLGIEHGEKLNLEQYLHAKNILSKEEMAILDKYEGRPKLMNGYAIFVKEFLSSQIKKIPANEGFQRSREMWKTLSPEQKKSYDKASRKLKIEYKCFIDSLPDDRREYELRSSKTTNGKKMKKENQNVCDENITNQHDENWHINNSQEPVDKSIINAVNDEEYELQSSSKKKESKKIKKENQRVCNVNIADQIDENSEINNFQKHVDESFINLVNDEEYELQSKSKKKKSKKLKKEMQDVCNENITNQNDENSKITNFEKHVDESIFNSVSDKEDYELQSKSKKKKSKKLKKEKKDVYNENTTDQSDENLQIDNFHKHKQTTVIEPQANDFQFEGHNIIRPHDKKKKKASKRKHLEETIEEIHKEKLPKTKYSNESSMEVGTYPMVKIISNVESDLSEVKDKKREKTIKKEKRRSNEKNLDETADSMEQIQESQRVISESKLKSPVKDENEMKLEWDKTSAVLPKKLVQPPSSAYKYYVLNIYRGPMDKAKASYKSLSESKKKSIEKKRLKAYDKFLKDLKEYSRSIGTEASRNLQKILLEEPSDEISDLTSTDSQ